MDDISQSTWKETNEANISPAPRGLPSNANPDAVPATIRFILGAIKRFWNRQNASATTTGTGGAYVLTYDVAPSALVKGETYRFWVHAASLAAPTLNINGLGARALFGADGVALNAGDLAAGIVVSATFDGTGFRITVPLTKGQLDAGLASTRTYSDTGDTSTLASAKTYSDNANATTLANSKSYTDTTTTTATAPLLKRAGDRLTGALSSAVKAHGTLSGTVTETFNYADGNTHTATVNGTVTINPTGLVEGDTMQINVLFQSGSIAVSGTTQWEGAANKSTVIGDTGITLVAGKSYRVIFEMVGGLRTGFFV